MSWLKKLFGSAPEDTDEPSPEWDVDAWLPNIEQPPKNQPELPRFSGAASDRLHHGGNSPIDKSRAAIRAAFTPSQPVTDIMRLVGRENLLTEMIRAIEDRRMHVVLYGERGMGKTSLLYSFVELARQADYKVVYLSCSGDADFVATFRSVAQTIPLLFHADFSATDIAVERGDRFDSLLPQSEPITVHSFSSLFSKIEGTRVIVVVDEFDRSPPGAFRRSISELIKNLSDRSSHLQLVLAGVSDNLVELIENVPSIRRNVAGIQVDGLSAGSITSMLELAERDSGVNFSNDARNAIIASSCGAPYLAVLLSHQAAIAAIDRNSLTVEQRDFDLALKTVLEEARRRLSVRSMDQVARAERDNHADVLAVLAGMVLRHGGKIDCELAVQTGSTRAVCDEAVKLGLDYGVIEPVEGDLEARYRFVEEGVPVYLWMAMAARNLHDIVQQSETTAIPDENGWPVRQGSD